MKIVKQLSTIACIGLFTCVLGACSEEKQEQTEDSMSKMKGAASDMMDDAKNAASDLADKTEDFAFVTMFPEVIYIVQYDKKNVSYTILYTYN